MNKPLMDYCTELGLKVEEAITQNKTPQQLHEEISSMCIKCFKPIEDIQNCDMCNGHTEFYPNTEEQLKVNFINVDGSIL